MEPKRVYLDDRAEQSADVIIQSGEASSLSAAVRLGLNRLAQSLSTPRVTPTTP